MSDTTSRPRCLAVVLAAGDGRRLSSITTTATGLSVPKQYCSIWGGSTLFEDAVRRTQRVVDAGSILAVVAAQHRGYWDPLLARTAPIQRVVQPRNLGTGIGVLLPLLYAYRQDPGARVLLIPSDHHVHDEDRLVAAMRAADEYVANHPDQVVLLGLRPEEPDRELGYIVPSRTDVDGLFARVDAFVEKPSDPAAAELMLAGALWNAFIVCGRVSTMLAWYRERHPEAVRLLECAFSGEQSPGVADRTLELAYERLPTIDFSREVLPGREPQLRVLAVPNCGWSDLGTVRSVEKVMRRYGTEQHGHAMIGQTPAVVLAAGLQRHGRVAQLAS